MVKASYRAELEIERAPEYGYGSGPTVPQSAHSASHGAPPSDFFGGLISAQDSILRFRSGLINEGMLAFTKGSNYITGDVFNLDAPLPDEDQGIINVLGQGVTAIFENDLFNGGILNVQGGAVVEVLARHSFVNTGDMQHQSESDQPNAFLDWWRCRHQRGTDRDAQRFFAGRIGSWRHV